MSTTTICITGTDGEVYEGRQFQNSWGSAWFIWNALARAYLPGELSSVWTREQLQPLWALSRDPRLSVAERIALATTFDYVMIRRGECEWVAYAFDQFLKLYERRARATHTLQAQASYLRQLAVHPAVQEVCWQQSSVATTLWHVVDEPSGIDRPYNVRYDKKHWFLFDRYPELRPTPSRTA